MAQAPPVKLEKETTEHGFSIIDCPICLEHLRHPKSLPCLHTFCEECLSTFITGRKSTTSLATFFSCPVCRKEIIPPKPSSDPKLWSSHFPTNNFVVEMLKKENMTEGTMQHCKPCKNHNKTKEASFWCKHCGFFMCDSCKHKSHGYVLDYHEIFTLQELSEHPDALLSDDPVCDKHHEKSDLLCVDHSVLGCHKCIAVEHRKCDNVTTVSEYAKSLITGDKCTEITRMLDTGVKDLDILIQDLRCKLDIVSKDEKSTLQNLSSLEEWFQKMIAKLTDKVTRVWKAEQESIKENLERMEALRSSMLQTKLMSQTSKHKLPENHLVSTILRGKSEMTVCTEIVKKYIAKNECCRISFVCNEEMEALKSRNVIGKVETKKEPCGDLNTSQKSPLFGRSAAQVGTVTVPIPSTNSCCRITGILALTNGSIVLADNSNSRLICLATKSQVIDQLTLPNKPWDVCEMPDGNIAVSIWYGNMISIVRLSHSKFNLVRNVIISQVPYGIAYFNGNIHVTFPNTNPKQLCRVSGNGNVSKLQVLDNFNMHLTSGRSNDRLIGSVSNTSPSKTAVYSIQASREDVLQEVIKADVVKNAWGIDTDDEDNIYVCGYGTNNVVQISAVAFDTRELLTSRDVNRPIALSLLGCQLYISEDNSNILKIFKLF